MAQTVAPRRTEYGVVVRCVVPFPVARGQGSGVGDGSRIRTRCPSLSLIPHNQRHTTRVLWCCRRGLRTEGCPIFEHLARNP